MYNTAELMLLGEKRDDAILTQAKKQVNCHDVVNMQHIRHYQFPKGGDAHALQHCQ